MKEFLVYTGMRLGLLVASFAVVAGIWLLATGGDLPILPPLLVAFVVSGVASWYLLDRQREAFAVRVQSRADAAVSKFEERKAKEDADPDAEGQDPQDGRDDA